MILRLEGLLLLVLHGSLQGNDQGNGAHLHVQVNNKATILMGNLGNIRDGCQHSYRAFSSSGVRYC